MIRLPWTKRIEAAQAEAEQARMELEQTLAQRPRAEAVANELRRHKVANGWTTTIATIFGG